MRRFVANAYRNDIEGKKQPVLLWFLRQAKVFDFAKREAVIQILDNPSVVQVNRTNKHRGIRGMYRLEPPLPSPPPPSLEFLPYYDILQRSINGGPVFSAGWLEYLRKWRWCGFTQNGRHWIWLEAAYKKSAKNLLEEWLDSATSCSATFWQLLLFEAPFDFWGNLIKLLATYGNHKVL